jgi:hypothetical protein
MQISLFHVLRLCAIPNVFEQISFLSSNSKKSYAYTNGFKHQQFNKTRKKKIVKQIAVFHVFNVCWISQHVLNKFSFSTAFTHLANHQIMIKKNECKNTESQQTRTHLQFFSFGFWMVFPYVSSKFKFKTQMKTVAHLFKWTQQSTIQAPNVKMPSE